MTVYGDPWSNRPDENVFLGFYPEDHEAVVLRTFDNGLDSVRCVA